jgi:hypothetical protein
MNKSKFFLMLLVLAFSHTGVQARDCGCGSAHDWHSLLKFNEKFVHSTKYAIQRNRTAPGQNPVHLPAQIKEFFSCLRRSTLCAMTF